MGECRVLFAELCGRSLTLFASRTTFEWTEPTEEGGPASDGFELSHDSTFNVHTIRG